VRSGPDRAKDAAMAAMASPLLETGAIDGAKGILINVTGSSSLKLNEVIAASTLIQNAAHEDANIIFGAVLDERMGEDVKITVIATGFRDPAPERRERMLADATLLTTRHDLPPIRHEASVPRIEQRTLPTRFASETLVAQPPIRYAAQPRSEEPRAFHEEPRAFREDDARTEGRAEQAQEFRENFPGFSSEPTRAGHREMSASERIQAYTEDRRNGLEEPHDSGYVEVETEPGMRNFVPERNVQVEGVRSESNGDPLDVERLQATPGAYIPEAPKGPRPELVPVPASVFDDDFFRKPKDELRSAAHHAPETAWPEARVPSFAGYAAEPVAAEPSDDLDIPAFLRRNH
jgi:cell division protein FtsZ